MHGFTVWTKSILSHLSYFALALVCLDYNALEINSELSIMHQCLLRKEIKTLPLEVFNQE